MARWRAAAGQGFEDHVQVRPRRRGRGRSTPAHAVQRLQHRLAMFADEGPERSRLAAHQVGGQHCRNSSAASFSFRSRRPCGSLTTRRALAPGEAEDLGVVQVVGVDRRIAHQHRPGRRRTRCGGIRQRSAEPVGFRPAPPAARVMPPPPPSTASREPGARSAGDAAPLRLQQRGEGGSDAGLMRRDGVHHPRRQRHAGSARGAVRVW